MRKIKVIQVGTLHDHAIFTFRSLMRNTDCFEVLGLCIPDEDERARLESNEAKAEYLQVPILSLEEALNFEGLEAVAVESAETSATKYAQMFADKGVAIHLDKPGTADYDSFSKLVETLRAKNLCFHLGYMYRYNPMVKKALEMAKEGKFGDIYSVEAHMSVRHEASKHKWLERFEGGMMYFLGCHLAELVVRFMGEPKKVTPFNRPTLQNGFECDDLGFAVLEYDNGVSFVKSCAAEFNGFARRQLVICGTKATMLINPLEEHKPEKHFGEQREEARAIYTDYEVESSQKGNWYDSHIDMEPVQFPRYDEMMREFASIISGDMENPNSYDYELMVFKTVLRCCGVIKD